MLLSFSGAVSDKAKALVPGGVNSPARAFASVGGTPPVISSGKGSHIRDIDENEYIDFCYGCCAIGERVSGRAAAHLRPDGGA